MWHKSQCYLKNKRLENRGLIGKWVLGESRALLKFLKKYNIFVGEPSIINEICQCVCLLPGSSKNGSLFLFLNVLSCEINLAFEQQTNCMLMLADCFESLSTTGRICLRMHYISNLTFLSVISNLAHPCTGVYHCWSSETSGWF
jgi:hypothetical protein